MKVGAHFDRRFRLLELLRASLVVGGLYDLGFAAVMLVAPRLPSQTLELPLPGERFYLVFMATVLAMLGVLYFLAAKDPRRYSGIIAVAIAGRLAGAVGFAVCAAGRPELAGLWPLAAADAVFGLVHAGCWLPIRA